jgi:hypothetical protein
MRFLIAIASTPGRCASAAADIGHFGRHHGHELHVDFQRKLGNWIVGKTAS